MYHVVNKIQEFNTKCVFWIPEILILYITVKDGIFLYFSDVPQNTNS